MFHINLKLEFAVFFARLQLGQGHYHYKILYYLFIIFITHYLLSIYILLFLLLKKKSIYYCTVPMKVGKELNPCYGFR